MVVVLKMVEEANVASTAAMELLFPPDDVMQDNSIDELVINVL